MSAGITTQAEMGEIVGLSERQVRKYEKGVVKRYSADVLQKWAERTGQPVTYFTVPPVAPPTPTAQQHPGVAAMIAILQASPRDNAAVLAELEALLTATLPRPLNLPGQALDVALALLREQPQ